MILEDVRGMASIRKKHPGKAIVLTGGVFDVLHPGHIEYLRAAKRLGDILVVHVDTDEFVARRKGISRPVMPLAMRASVVDALACVDYVIYSGCRYHENRIVQLVRPTVVVRTDRNRTNQPGSVAGVPIVYLRESPEVHSTQLIERLIKKR